MDSLVQDIRQAIRALTNSRGFSVVAILTLALGIGANTAIFTVVDGVLLRPLRFRDADQLVRVTSDFAKQGVDDVGMGIMELNDVRDRANVFTDVAGIYPINVNLTAVDQPERIETQLVSANFFTLLGVEAQVGHVFTQADYQPGNVEVAVITDGLWARRFGRDPHVLGRKIRLDNDPYEIVGVLPASFHHPGRGLAGEPEIFGPSGYSATPFNKPTRGQFFLGGVIGRLKPGMRIDTAQKQIDQLTSQLRAENPKDYPEPQGWRMRIVPLQEDLVGKVRPLLTTLLAAVGAVLLIACANVANLSLARSAKRHREFALRGALGATRPRLVQQVLTESLVLAVIGGALGVLVADSLVSALLVLIPAGMPRAANIGVDGRVLAFSLVLSVVTGVLFGLWPALQASPSHPSETLKDSSRSVTANRQRSRMRSALIVTEFALALVLLVLATLLGRSFLRLYDVDPGFSTDHVLTARLWMPVPNDPTTGVYLQHDKRVWFFRASLDRIRETPGVESAAWSARLPLTGGRANAQFRIKDRPQAEGAVNSVEPQLATPDYFETLKIGLVEGRVFTDAETSKMPQTVVVSESFAKKYFPHDSAIDKKIFLGRGPLPPDPKWATIVGVVRDVRSITLDAAPTPQLYLNVWQQSSLSMALEVRTAGDPAQLVEPITRAIRSVDPELPLFNVQPMSAVLATSVAERRFSMIVIGVFGALALLLSAIGIYGVLAYLVQQRTSEIGVRMALGASRTDVLRLILGHGLALTTLGIGIGLVASAFAARTVANLLFSVTPFDAPTFAVVAAVLTTVAALACLVPAWRATRIDPLQALRQD